MNYDKQSAHIHTTLYNRNIFVRTKEYTKHFTLFRGTEFRVGIPNYTMLGMN